jgi:hypothetical protein
MKYPAPRSLLVLFLISGGAVEEQCGDRQEGLWRNEVSEMPGGGFLSVCTVEGGGLEKVT